MEKTCQNCKNGFSITSQDLDFYKKMDVPPPTFCPLCRAQRRFSWRNERGLYKREDSSSGEEIFSMYPQDVPFPVYKNERWWSDEWDPLEYGQEYDFSRPFLEQFKELLEKVPLPALAAVRMTNSDYSNNATGLKNCYLLFNSNYSENCSYGNAIDASRECVDNSHLRESELCYECFWLTRCSRAFFSSQCEDCTDVWFSKNLRGCTDCFGCVNLRNKRHYVFNEACSKDEYERKLQEFCLDSYAALQKVNERTRNFWREFPNKFIEGIKNDNVNGAYISHSKNVLDSYLVREGKDLRYCQYLQVPKNEDCYDHSIWGNNNVRTYECAVCGLGTNNIKFCSECWPEVSNLEYCHYCVSSSDCFGCASLRKKRYCILNKQYSETEYKELAPRIKEHMNEMPYVDKKGREYRYGEFFPIEFSPFGYNETIAQEHFPLTKEQALEEGFLWRDEEGRGYTVTVSAGTLPDTLKETGENIMEEVIECAHKGECNDNCPRAFKLTPQELQFYERFNLPLPRLCPNCRHRERLKQRNSIRIWERKCMCGGRGSDSGGYENATKHFHGTEYCPNEFKTSYPSDSPEIVYCEECYQQEVI